MSVTRTWKVYGNIGHRQRVSFRPSFRWNFSTEADGARVIECENSDKTGTNDFCVIRITRDTSEQCEHELSGQITDGIFEDSRVGQIEEITD